MYTITHPIKGYSGEYGGVQFTKGVATLDATRFTFPLSIGASFEEGIKKLEAMGCRVENPKVAKRGAPEAASEGGEE